MKESKIDHSFTPFAESLPEQGRWILVTNNLEATKKNGEMSHLWLTDFWYKYPSREIITYDSADTMIHNLTHWKYAIEEGG